MKGRVHIVVNNNMITIKNNNISCNDAKLLDIFKNVAQKINIDATPSIITEDGKIVVGAISIDYLKQLLN